MFILLQHIQIEQWLTHYLSISQSTVRKQLKIPVTILQVLEGEKNLIMSDERHKKKTYCYIKQSRFTNTLIYN